MACRAYVEVKPILYAAKNEETAIDHVRVDLSPNVGESYWGFQHENWHNFCLQKCIVRGKMCAVILSITDEVAVKICSEESTNSNQVDVGCQGFLTERKMERIARFCLYRLDKILLENYFSWDDATVSFSSIGKKTFLVFVCLVCYIWMFCFA